MNPTTYLPFPLSDAQWAALLESIPMPFGITCRVCNGTGKADNGNDYMQCGGQGDV